MKEFWSVHHHELENPGWGLEHFARKLAPAVRGKKVLDLGCGAGHLSRMLTDAGARVTGVDFVPELLAMARGQAAGPGGQRPEFVLQDILQLDLGDTFDCICGVAILHEIPSAAFPELLNRIALHLAPGGFCAFQENSYFNPIYRAFRQHVVGRAGVRKVGSHEETPFDQLRWELVKSHFRHASRACDVFVMLDRIWYQFMDPHVRRWSTRLASACGHASARFDQYVSREIGNRPVTLYWSWLQTIYFADGPPYEDVFPV